MLCHSCEGRNLFHYSILSFPWQRESF